jgi:LPS-assembly lipoprotein
LWSKAIIYAFVAVSMLANCGLTPVNGPGGVQWQNAVVVDAPDSVLGFRMAERFDQVLGPATRADYRLSVAPQSEAESATITEDGDSTRFNLTGNASWTLVDGAGQEIASGLEQTFTSYSATGTTVATQAAESDAEARLAVALADLIMRRLVLLDADQ